MQYKTVNTLTALDESTDSLIPVKSVRIRQLVNLSITGTFAGTIALQRKFRNTADWLTTDTFTVPTESSFEATEPNVEYRLTMEAYTSGSAEARLSY
ncbi:MAG: hypothetical protein U9O94_06020 [Nanoarchaeota archaeon]|nr:hypothetical protein [Nanoarchaeota archaeon]